MSAISALKMRGWTVRINTFFPACVLMASLWMAGCASDPATKKEPKKDSEVAALRVHVELRDGAEGGRTISVLRASPVSLLIEKEPFLDERDLKSAKLVDTVTGFAISATCTLHGRLVLEMTSVSRTGRHLAIVSTWESAKDKTETRWIAAPVLKGAIREGVLTFVPDCSREEAEHIVRGLNNVAIKLKNQEKPPKPSKKPAAEEGSDDLVKPFKESR